MFPYIVSYNFNSLLISAVSFVFEKHFINQGIIIIIIIVTSRQHKTIKIKSTKNIKIKP